MIIMIIIIISGHLSISNAFLVKTLLLSNLFTIVLFQTKHSSYKSLASVTLKGEDALRKVSSLFVTRSTSEDCSAWGQGGGWGIKGRGPDLISWNIKQCKFHFVIFHSVLPDGYEIAFVTNYIPLLVLRVIKWKIMAHGYLASRSSQRKKVTILRFVRLKNWQIVACKIHYTHSCL